MFVKDVRIGETLEFEHVNHGVLGSMRIESKYGDVVRLVFDVPRAIIIRAINRATVKSFGLLGAECGNSRTSGLPRNAA